MQPGSGWRSDRSTSWATSLGLSQVASKRGHVRHRSDIGQAQAVQVCAQPVANAVPMAPAAPVISTGSVRGSIASVPPNETVADRNRLRQAAVSGSVTCSPYRRRRSVCRCRA
jgi:hypothetical protein